MIGSLLTLLILSSEPIRAQSFNKVSLKPTTVLIEGKMYKAFDSTQFRVIASELSIKQALKVQVADLNKLSSNQERTINIQSRQINSLDSLIAAERGKFSFLNQKYDALQNLYSINTASYEKQVKSYNKKLIGWKIGAGALAIAAGILAIR